METEPEGEDFFDRCHLGDSSGKNAHRTWDCKQLQASFFFKKLDVSNQQQRDFDKNLEPKKILSYTSKCFLNGSKSCCFSHLWRKKNVVRWAPMRSGHYNCWADYSWLISDWNWGSQKNTWPHVFLWHRYAMGRVQNSEHMNVHFRLLKNQWFLAWKAWILRIFS